MSSINNQAVAFLDVLGFKNMVNSSHAEIIGKEYERLIDDTLFHKKFISFTQDFYKESEGLEKPPGIFVLSDSIIIVAKDDTFEGILSFVVLIWKVLQASIIQKLPIRGGVSYGDLYVNESKNIVVGKALVEAYELESSTDWIGISIHQNFEPMIQRMITEYEGFDQLLKTLTPFYPVPFKETEPQTLRTINWRMNITLQHGTKHYVNPDAYTGSVKIKYENTLLYAKAVKSYVSWPDMHPIFIHTQVSDTPPNVIDGIIHPDPHGDEY